MKFSEIMENNKGITSGFDYLRILLAIAVVSWHSILTTQGHDAEIWSGYLRPLPAIILPMFFCLSGFLVASSLQRSANMHDFLMLRAIRLVPALFVETILAAIILGPLVTTLPLAEYFSHSLFWSYFLNILGIVHLYLPGVFEDNIFPAVVNINLRTLPSELECYVILAILGLLKFTRKPKSFTLIVLMGTLAATLWYLPRYAALQSTPPLGVTLVLAFLNGVCFNLLKDRLPHNLTTFIISAIATIVLLLNASTQFIALPFIAYVTCYLGLLTPPKKTFLLRGDYSYGLYLFGFPLQQLYAMIFAGNLTWYGSLAFSLTLGIAYACFSWHCVEKPILERKKNIILAFRSFYSAVLSLGSIFDKGKSGKTQGSSPK